MSPGGIMRPGFTATGEGTCGGTEDCPEGSAFGMPYPGSERIGMWMLPGSRAIGGSMTVGNGENSGTKPVSRLRGMKFGRAFAGRPQGIRVPCETRGGGVMVTVAGEGGGTGGAAVGEG